MASQWLKNLSHKAAHVRMLQPIYTASLGKLDAPLDFQSYPINLFAGDGGRGKWLVAGQLDINGHRVPMDKSHWFLNTPIQDTPYFDKCHGFEFLSELIALGGTDARKTARILTQDWLDDFENYHGVVWAPALTATRLVNWLIAYGFAYETAPEDFIDRFHLCIFKHYHHILNCLDSNAIILDEFDRFACLWAIIIVQCHCDDLRDDMAFQSHCYLMKGVLEDIVLPDGGIIDRNPCNKIEIAKSLIQLRQSMQQGGMAAPLWLSKQLESLVKTMTVMTHMDKDFPHFHGATMPNKNIIETIIKLSATRHRRSDVMMPDYGYTAMRKGRTSIIIDHGRGDKSSHISPLSFEIGFATNRMIVNCGTYDKDPKWREAMAGMAAHNTLMIEDSEPKASAIKPKATLDHMNGASLFSGTHDAYAANYGLTHTRRIYLDSDGEDIRGEDVLVRGMALRPLPVTIRFHLHPSVKASMIEGKTSVLMKLPTGAGWMFHAGAGHLTLDESVHCADGFQLRKTSQIVMHVQMDDLSAQFKWGLKRQ